MRKFSIPLYFALILTLAFVPFGTQAETLADRLTALVGQARQSQQVGDTQAALDKYREAAGLLDAAQPDHRATLAFLLNEVAVLARKQLDSDVAIAAATRAVNVQRGAPPDPLRLGVYLLNLGLSSRDGGALSQSRQALAEARSLIGALSPPRPDLASLVAESYAAVLLEAGLIDSAADVLRDVLAQDLPPANRLSILHQLAQAELLRRLPAAARATLDVAELLVAAADLPAQLYQQLLEARTYIQEADTGTAEAVLMRVRSQAQAAGLGELAASAQYNLADIAFTRGDFSLADLLNRQSEAMYLDLHGPNHVSLAQTVHRRALIYQEIGDLDSALDLYEEARARFVRSVGSGHPLWFSSEVERVQLLSLLGRHDEAIALAQSLPGPEGSQVPADSYDRILAQASLGLALFRAGRIDEAGVQLQAVQDRRKQGNYPLADEPNGLTALAEIRLKQGRIADAAAAAGRAFQIREAGLAETVDRLGESRRVLADIALARGDLTHARSLAEQNIALIERRLEDLSRSAAYASEFAPAALRAQVGQMLGILWASANGAPQDADIAQMFAAAQLVHLNETTRATNGFVQRLGSTDPTASALLQARRNVAETLRAAHQQLANRAADRAAAGVDTGRADLLARISDLEVERAALDQRLASEAPDLMAVLTPSPVALPDLRASLRGDEAFWMQATFDTVTYVFLIRRDAVAVARSDYGTAALRGDVDLLRQAVDVTNPEGLRAFDMAAAARVFQGLLGPFSDQIDTVSKLVLVPDLAAQEMSLAVLVRETAAFGPEYGAGDPRMRFLGLTHALNVIPSPTSFLRLRQSQRLVLSDGGFVGFGDPALTGDGGVDTRGLRRAIDSDSGLANPQIIRSVFEPLEETAAELRLMAQLQGSEHSRLFLRGDMTETQAKAADYSGVGVVAFATHAIVTGDFDHLAEPALVMSPPDQPSDQDDGLLTASEIARLSIGADLVVLSACNTGATSGRTGAAGLSGLASGFFRAGARSLVVSHWTIFSVSSLLIMPPFFKAATGDQAQEPAEAMRLAMLAVANDTRDPKLSHPAVWAPFVVVGDR